MGGKEGGRGGKEGGRGGMKRGWRRNRGGVRRREESRGERGRGLNDNLEYL